MSAVYQIVCETHGQEGPKIRRTVGMRGVLHAADLPATAEGKEQGEREWGAFLGEHEYCDLRLRLGP